MNGFIHFSAMSGIKSVRMNRASHASMPLTERKNGESFSVARGSAWRAYPSSFYPTNLGALQLDQTFRCMCQHHWFLHQLWCWSVYIISPEWLLCPFSIICHSPDLYIPLIFCIPGGLGVRRIQSLNIMLVKQGRGIFRALHCDVQLWGLLWCS